jgi:hypothetical protein
VSFAKKELFDSKKYIWLAQKIKPEIKKGSAGLLKLEKLGYFWSRDEKEVLKTLFIELGYDKANYENDDNIGKAKAKPKAVKLKIISAIFGR